MAWIDSGDGGYWIEREERTRRLEEGQAMIDKIDKLAPTVEDKERLGLLVDYYKLLKEVDKFERVNRVEFDLYEFVIEYFSESRNEGNQGNLDGFDVTKREDGAKFHLEMCEILDDVSEKNGAEKLAIGAPRGHAKSTYFSKAFPIREIVMRKRVYGIIISETPDVAKSNMEWIKSQLIYNHKLRNDFGPLLESSNKRDIRSNQEEFIASHLDENGELRQIALLQSASVGGALRGRNWQGKRPDLIVMDDLEDARPGGNASTPEQRAKLHDWFNQTVLPLGDPAGKSTTFIIVGTTVHFDSLLMKVLYRSSEFKSKVYRSIMKEPERLDLWEQCRAIYQDHENPNRRDEAIQFYKDNKELMNKGAVVLWEEAQPIQALMFKKWDMGSKAFNTEYQNNPIDEESMIFNPNEFTYWTDSHPNRKFPHDEYEITMGIDFAMGKKVRGDYSAIVTVARNRETDVSYVIDAYGDKIHPNDFLEIIVDKVIAIQPDMVAVESQMAQEFFVDILTEYLSVRGYPPTRVKKIQQRNRKELRIEALIPHVETGKLQFDARHSLLLEQLERFGQGGHDDLPDALEMAFSSNGESRRRIVSKPFGIF